MAAAIDIWRIFSKDLNLALSRLSIRRALPLNRPAPVLAFHNSLTETALRNILSDAGIRAYLVSTAPKSTTIWVIDFQASISSLDHHWNLLSRDEQERANRYRFDKDRVCFALTRISLRLLLAAKLDTVPQQLRFAASQFGKPYVADSHGLNFNVSHSGNFALIGVARNRPIGVDIEQIRDNIDAHDLAQIFFSEAEAAFLLQFGEHERRQAFYQIWTCKEALLKGYGLGITEYLKDFSVSFSQDGVRVLRTASCRLPLRAFVLLEALPAPQGYAATLALI